MAKYPFPRKVAWIACAGGANVGGQTSPEGGGGCRSLAEGGDSLTCRYGCVGQGDCIRACKQNAITINETGVAEVDGEKCTDCGQCLDICPQGLIHMRLYDAPILTACSNRDPGGIARKICSVSCTACKICERSCPSDAIRVDDNLACIDEEACLVCGLCVTRCPRKTVVDVQGVILP